MRVYVKWLDAGFYFIFGLRKRIAVVNQGEIKKASSALKLKNSSKVESKLVLMLKSFSEVGFLS